LFGEKLEENSIWGGKREKKDRGGGDGPESNIGRGGSRRGG